MFLFSPRFLGKCYPIWLFFWGGLVQPPTSFLLKYFVLTDHPLETWRSTCGCDLDEIYEIMAELTSVSVSRHNFHNDEASTYHDMILIDDVDDGAIHVFFEVDLKQQTFLRVDFIWIFLRSTCSIYLFDRNLSIKKHLQSFWKLMNSALTQPHENAVGFDSVSQRGRFAAE